MADPNYRYTSNLNIRYPAADLDPWDEQYEGQMSDLDIEIMMTQQRIGIILGPQTYGDMSWDSPTSTLTLLDVVYLLVPRWGFASIRLMGGPFAIPSGQALYVSGPAGVKWNTPGILGSTGIGAGPFGVADIPVFLNSGGTGIFLLEQATGAK